MPPILGATLPRCVRLMARAVRLSSIGVLLPVLPSAE